MPLQKHTTTINEPLLNQLIEQIIENLQTDNIILTQYHYEHNLQYLSTFTYRLKTFFWRIYSPSEPVATIKVSDNQLRYKVKIPLIMVEKIIKQVPYPNEMPFYYSNKPEYIDILLPTISNINMLEAITVLKENNFKFEQTKLHFHLNDRNIQQEFKQLITDDTDNVSDPSYFKTNAPTIHNLILSDNMFDINPYIFEAVLANLIATAKQSYKHPGLYAEYRQAIQLS